MTKILVVDDSPVDRCLAQGLLETQSAWEVLEAADGKQALAIVQKDSPDVVVSDLQMPEMNGLELVSAMREHNLLIPVIIMTSHGNEEIAVRALREGAASYLPKRSLANELVEVVQRVIDVSHEDKAYARLLSHMECNDSRFELTNDLKLITSLVTYLREGVTQMGICDESDQFRVAVALEEALLNAYFHGNLEVSSHLREEDHGAFMALAEERRKMEPYAKRHIYVHAELTPQQAKFTIRDQGPGFDPSKLPDPTDPLNLARPCGRGVLLMRAFMDSVTYNSVGNEVTMMKERCEEES